MKFVIMILSCIGVVTVGYFLGTALINLIVGIKNKEVRK